MSVMSTNVQKKFNLKKLTRGDNSFPFKLIGCKIVVIFTLGGGVEQN